MTTKVDNTEEK